MIAEIRTGIYTLGAAITGLTGGFWWLEAPQGTAFPYAVFSQVTHIQDRDTASKFEEIYFQINHYANSAAALETIAKASKAKFEDSENDWTLTEYHLDRIEFQLSRESKNGDVFQTTHQYKLELTKL